MTFTYSLWRFINTSAFGSSSGKLVVTRCSHLYIQQGSDIKLRMRMRMKELIRIAS